MATVQADEKGGWQLAEDSAEAYERYLVPALLTAMADHVLDLAEPKAGDSLLDVGCGTGIVARRAVPRLGATGRIVGLDLNDGMLAVARRVSSGLRPAIEWRQGDAAALPLPDAAFDRVTCQQALQFFTERSTALSEMRRVLAPGGRAAIAVLRPVRFTPVYEPVAQALERHAGVQAGAMMRSPFPDWQREQFRIVVAAGGFEQVKASRRPRHSGPPRSRCWTTTATATRSTGLASWSSGTGAEHSAAQLARRYSTWNNQSSIWSPMPAVV